MSADVDVAIAAARAGAAVVVAAYGTEPVRHAKTGQDFATDTDLAAERAIADVLRAARPGDSVVGEEFGAAGDPAAARRGLVDPLCGTVNFAARTPLFSTNVALQVDGRVEVAAVGEPLSGEVFWSSGAATGIRRGDADAALTPSAGCRLVNVNIDGPADAWFVGPQILADADLLARFHLRVASTTLALAWVAAGRHAAYVTDGDLRGSVHFAAGLALCRAAGCVVTDLSGGPVDGGRGAVTAADADTHAAVLAAVDRIRRAAAPDA